MAKKIENFDNEANEPVAAQNDANDATDANVVDDARADAVADDTTAAESTPTESTPRAQRAWLKPVGIAAASVLALGLAFGAGAAAGKFIAPPAGAAGVGHIDGLGGHPEGDRDGDHDGDGRGQHGPGQLGEQEDSGTATTDTDTGTTTDTTTP